MVITAKFASVCPCCSIRIVAGSKVEWSKGSPARHVACTASATRTTVSAAPGASRILVTAEAARRSYRRTRGARYCEGWGADNPHAPRAPYTCDECGHDGC